MIETAQTVFSPIFPILIIIQSFNFFDIEAVYSAYKKNDVIEYK